MSKEPMLFVCHRIPFPPNKGDKIRSFNMLKALSEKFDIYLASFVDDPYDWQFADKLNAFCQDKLLLGQNKSVSKLKGTSAFLTGKAISLPYYYNGKMQRWIDDILTTHKINNVFVYSSVMAQFFSPQQLSSLKVVVDFVDVDSDKWRQYAAGKTGLEKWIYSREHIKLAEFENYVAHHVKSSLFVSPQEAELFKQQLPVELRSKVSGILNGVDTTFFNPGFESDESFNESVDVVFTGAMDYWANIDAVVWFSKYVWPLIIAKQPGSTFYIVGGNPSEEVKALHNNNGIKVTGRVKDVRPYIQASKVAVAPLQIARGIQNKVLEAMSMEKAVVATSMAIEGIETDTKNVVVTDDPHDFAEQVLGLCGDSIRAEDNRKWILENLQWQSTLELLPDFFESI